MHPTQLFVVGWQNGVVDFDAQSAFETQPTHELPATSHTGLPGVATQSELATHSTQVLASSLQTGVEPEQNAPEVHCTHVFRAVQAGVGAAHSLSLRHATQTFAAGLQTGKGAAHAPEHGTWELPASPAIPAIPAVPPIPASEAVPPAPAKLVLVMPPFAPPVGRVDWPPVEELPPTMRLSS